MLDSNLCGIVGDFGFALEIPKSVSGRTQITAPLIARTEGYLPPELISGKISPLSDVYSCGVVSSKHNANILIIITSMQLTLEVYTSLMPFCKNRPDNELVWCSMAGCYFNFYYYRPATLKMVEKISISFWKLRISLVVLLQS